MYNRIICIRLEYLKPSCVLGRTLEVKEIYLHYDCSQIHTDLLCF